MKIFVSSFLFLLAVMSFAPAAMAKGVDVEIDKYAAICADAGDQAKKATCLGRQYAIVDAKVKAAWLKALTAIENNSSMPASVRGQWKHNFREAQNFWTRYKEAECGGSIPYQYVDGTKASVESLGCFLRLDVVRLLQLQHYLK